MVSQLFLWPLRTQELMAYDPKGHYTMHISALAFLGTTYIESDLVFLQPTKLAAVELIETMRDLKCNLIPFARRQRWLRLPGIGSCRLSFTRRRLALLRGCRDKPCEQLAAALRSRGIGEVHEHSQ